MFVRLKILFKRYFIAGLFILIPVFIALFSIVFIVKKFDELFIPENIRQGIREALGIPLPGLGLLVFIVFSIITGVIARNILGRKIIEWNDRLLRKLPLAGPIYSGTTQILSAVRMKDSKAFRKVVLIEYPRKGIYSLAFITGKAKEEMQAAIGAKALVNLFVPTTPNPTSGFFLLIAEEDTLAVNLTVPEAFRLIVSAGMVGKENDPLNLHHPQ
jgi:uncharacterized membrane protein